MILLDINPRASKPIYRQIIDQLTALIDGDGLGPGDRLPPTRQLAQQLGVHRSTVVRAYDELWALGYLESRQGGYSTVRRRQKTVQSPKPRHNGFEWKTVIPPEIHAALAAVRLKGEPSGKPGLIDLESFDLDPRLIPAETLRKSLNQALYRDGAALLHYGPSAGYRPLRELIARRLAVHAIHVTPDEILITHGAQHGLDLILRLLTRPGDTVAVEDPTYSLLLPLITTHGLTPAAIPMRDNGMDLDHLEALLQTQPPKLIYTMPNFHNPTGITTDQPHRERLLTLCERHDVVLVEDAFDEEMKYFGRVPLPIKSMDRRGLVIYLGTFSKVLSPGLRLGWIAAPVPCVQALTGLRRALDLSSPLPLQAAITEMLRRNDFDRHIQRLHRAFRHRMQTAVKALGDNLPSQVRWQAPSGGYLLWLTLEGLHLPEPQIIARLLQGGVRVSPGSAFHVDPSPWPCLRLSISLCSEKEIGLGLERLGTILTRLYEAQSSQTS